MDSLWFAWLAIALLAAFTALVPSWPWAFFSWEFRSPEKMKPSARRFRIFSAHCSILAVAFGALFVGSIWPGDALTKTGAGLAALIVGYLGLGVLLLVLTYSRRRAARLAREDADIPANEPSEEGYALLYLSVAFTAVALGFCAVWIYGIAVADAKRDAPLTAEEQAAVDENVEGVEEVLDDMFDGMNDRTFDWHIHAQLPLVEAAPEGAIVASPLYTAVLDAVAREPEAIWEYSSAAVAGTGTTDELLAGADIVVGITSWRCEVTGIVVVETAETVTVGLIVTLPAEPSGVAPSPTPNAEQSAIPECEMVGGSKRTWYPVDLEAPLGDRELLTVDGSPLSGWG